MALKYYELSFYLNALHKFPEGEYHAHTWEIELKLVDVEKNHFKYHQIEENVNDWLTRLEDKKLNELILFDSFIPTTEKIAEVLYFSINEIINNIGYRLEALKIIENGNRKYIISKSIIDSFAPFDTEKEYSIAKNNLAKFRSQIQNDKKANKLNDTNINTKLIKNIITTKTKKKAKIKFLNWLLKKKKYF